MQEGVANAEYVNDLELAAFKVMPSLQQMKIELEVSIKDRSHALAQTTILFCLYVRFSKSRAECTGT